MIPIIFGTFALFLMLESFRSLSM